MDEELQKRNTDCVYFLASPLTCKKGMECEYRHSEIARLNPRDCWYWLAGSCLNPSCAFRHPPLDVHAEVTEALPDSTAQPHPGLVPVTKSNVPCYFFFNGFCNKGDKCSFLHGPAEDGKPGWKSSKTAAVTAAPLTDAKTSTGSDAGSTPIGTNPDISKASHDKTAETKNNLKEDAYLENIKKRSASPQIPASEHEEVAAVSSGTLLPGKDVINQSPQISTDESSEEQLNRHNEREEWLESSPGFDVLVDDVSENLGYEDDSEYVLPVDRDGRELNNGHFYDYEDPAEYDPIYADAVALYDQDRRVSRDERDLEPRVDYIRNGNGRSIDDHIMGPVYSRKRKYFPMDMVIGGRRSEDLRDHLKKRRVIDDRRHPPPFSRRNHIASAVTGRSRDRSSRPHHRPRGILTSEMEERRKSNPRQQQRSQKERRKPRHQVVPSEVVSRRHDSRRRRLTEEESSTFSGPKTLAQIKEDKMKSAEKRNLSTGGGHRSRSTEEFQGPKPLSEILKEKSQVP